MNIAIQTVPLRMPHPGQQTILRHPARFKVVACGRRFGKTELAKLVLLERALHDGGHTWWLAPTYLMASQVWRDLKTALQQVADCSISETERRIDFATGGTIAIRSTHAPDHLRGAGLDYVVLDEAAYMEPGIWPEIVRPMLLDRQGGALFLSTPFGRNWFYDLFRLGLDEDQPDWASFHFTSLDNPTIARSEFAALRRSTSERVWREEYLAEFSEDAGRVFRGLREVSTAPLKARPINGRRYVAGVDWGREADYTAIVILDLDSRQMVALDRFHQIGWEVQRGRLAALCGRWNVELILAEANSVGSVNIEALQSEGLPVRAFTTTQRSKTALIEGLALAIEQRKIELQPHETLLGELRAYALERLPGGGYRYGAPPGMHDDTVMALALAWQAARFGGVGLDFV